MSVYTVHEPPQQNASPDRVVFVRDGFHFWAMVFGPLWLLWRRLWLALVFYVVAWVAVEGTLYVLKASQTAQGAIAFLFALLLGMEASSVWRWTLDRRGYKERGVVVGDDLESAERRFFQTWREQSETAAPKNVLTSYGPKPSENGNDVIGLFPEPGGSR